jgi:hypothetical protein
LSSFPHLYKTNPFVSRRGKACLARCYALTTAILILLLAACEGETPTLTPTRELSGPTLEASATFMPEQPTNAPPEAVFVGQNDPTAAALAPDSALPPLAVPGSLAEGDLQSIEITADDGTQLLGDLYVSPVARMPGVVLVAPEGSGWGDFPRDLHAAGFTVLVMTPREISQVEDLRVMLKSLSSGTALPDRLAAVGADVGADMVLMGCASEPLCDAAALLSPSDSAALLDAMVTYNPRPIFLTATQEDTVSYNAITALQAASAPGMAFFQPFETAGHGTALLLNRPDLGDLLIEWLHQQLA